MDVKKKSLISIDFACFLFFGGRIFWGWGGRGVLASVKFYACFTKFTSIWERDHCL